MFVKKVHRYLLEFHDAAFYLWAVALAIVSGQTVRSLANSDAPVFVEVLIALAGLITCCVQFYLGKKLADTTMIVSVAGRRWGKKHSSCHLDVLYVFESAVFCGAGIVCTVAKYNQ